MMTENCPLFAGDLHDQTYNTMVATFEVSKYGTPGYEKVTGHCVYMMVRIKCTFILVEILSNLTLGLHHAACLPKSSF